MFAQQCMTLLRMVLGVSIVLGLLFAQVQLAGVAKASAGMAMMDGDCQPPPSCCDKTKPGCLIAPSCFAPCGGAVVFEPESILTFPVLAGEVFALPPVPLTPYAAPPLRRPPRP
ncbi:MAG: hypothetical protein WCE69_06705 [Aestuariivirga sp.]